MPQPILSQVHIDRAITQAAQRYRNSMFISGDVCPIVPVVKESDLMFIYDKAEWFRDVADKNRRPGTRAARGGYTVSNLRYSLAEIAIAHGVPDRIVESADDPLRPIQDGTDWCMQIALLRREVMCAGVIMAASAWGTNTTLSGVNQWSDFVNSDPANDIQTAVSTVLQNTGFRPNTLIVGQQVHDKLILNPDLLDRFKYTQAAIPTPPMIAQWLGIERYLVGGATRNTAAEGQTATMSYVWGKHALVCYCPPAPAIQEPAACYTFQRADVQTRSFYEEAEKQTVVECTLLTDPRIIGTDLGYQYRSAVA